MRFVNTVKNIKQYLVRTTEEVGISTEYCFASLANVPFNTKRDDIIFPVEMKRSLEKALMPILNNKVRIVEHLGHKNGPADFVTSDNKSVSLKTVMSVGSKVCPQFIGQCSLQRLNEKLKFNLQDTQAFKQYFLDNLPEMLSKYLEHYCCDHTFIVMYKKGLVHWIQKTDVPTFSPSLTFETSKTIDNWSESSTVYTFIDGKRLSLGECQVHNNRNCIKFRFNNDCILTLIRQGKIIGLAVEDMEMDNKYAITVEKAPKPARVFTSFNYIGSKMNLLDFVQECIQEYTKQDISKVNSFADVCSGTGIVSYHMMKNGCKNVLTNDIQHYAYIVSSAWTTHGSDMTKIRAIVQDLNKELHTIDETQANTQDFMFHTYTEACQEPRKYLTKLNGLKVDKTRQKIEHMLQTNVINNAEYRILIKLLLYAVTAVSNIASVYGAFLKQYKTRAQAPLHLDEGLLDKLLQDDTITHHATNQDLMSLLQINDLASYDVVYIDPPYNTRRYDHNFHLLETVSKYDYPKVKGKTGTRVEDDKKSNFCSKTMAQQEFASVFSKIKSKYIFISYNSESIVSKDRMMELLSTHWDNVHCFEKQYSRFKSNKNNTDAPTHVTEYIFAATQRTDT
jgi:adenine-specific DNA-methyltransferase